MSGILDKFRRNIVASVWKEKADAPQIRDIDDKIALGVLLWVVAEADDRFLPEEEAKIREILVAYSKIPPEDIAIVLSSIQQAAKERIDLYTFTNEVSRNLLYTMKISIIEALFRVACADKELDNNELEIIRKISGLLKVSHKDFINAKIKIKKSFGLDTAGL